MRVVAVLLIASLATCATAHAESMRCGKWVVDENASPAELLQKCGEPVSKEVTTEDVLGKNQLGNPIKLGTQVTERWHYQLSKTSLPRVVTIVDGKIKDIRLGDS